MHIHMCIHLLLYAWIELTINFRVAKYNLVNSCNGCRCDATEKWEKQSNGRQKKEVKADKKNHQ
jgi:hypothetical protein